MSMINSVLKTADKIFNFKVAYAHCDVPCGIYDPHMAQMAAHTVIRMVDLIKKLQTEKHDDHEHGEEHIHALARHTAVKEHHAELCKHEIRILWGDYFKPEHVEKFPELHSLVWKVMKLGSNSKQEINLPAAEELLDTVNRIAEIFWKTKSVETVKRKSFYPTERDIVLPKV